MDGRRVLVRQLPTRILVSLLLFAFAAALFVFIPAFQSHLNLFILMQVLLFGLGFHLSDRLIGSKIRQRGEERTRSPGILVQSVEVAGTALMGKSMSGGGLKSLDLALDIAISTTLISLLHIDITPSVPMAEKDRRLEDKTVFPREKPEPASQHTVAIGY